MSTAFPRTILPVQSSWPLGPAGLQSWGQTGKGQFRSTLAVGRSWTETYGPLKASNTDVRAFLAFLDQAWREQTILEVDHRSMRTMLGVGSGTPVVRGSSQTGSTLVTDGWSLNYPNIMVAGDIFRVAGHNHVYEVTATCASLASGTCLLAITPTIAVGHSLADSAVITTNHTPGAVTFRCVLTDAMNVPRAGPDEYYLGLQVTFREAP